MQPKPPVTFGRRFCSSPLEGSVNFNYCSGGSIHHGRHLRGVRGWSAKHVWLLKSVVHLKFKDRGGWPKSTKRRFKQKSSLALQARAEVGRKPELHRFRTRVRLRQLPIAVYGGLPPSQRAVMRSKPAPSACMHVSWRSACQPIPTPVRASGGLLEK